MIEDQQCLQRDATEGRCLEEGCGKNMLDVYVIPRCCDECTAMVKTGNDCLLGNYMSTHGNFCCESLLRPNAVQGQSFSLGLVLNTLLAESETYKRVGCDGMLWGTKHAEHTAYHGTRHRTGLSAHSRDL